MKQKIKPGSAQDQAQNWLERRLDLVVTCSYSGLGSEESLDKLEKHEPHFYDRRFYV